MKKSNLIFGLLAIGLGACTSDGPVNPTPEPTPVAETPMGFISKKQNTSRAELETVEKTFGVWAIKAQNLAGFTGTNLSSTDATNIVMKNYMVNHTSNTTGYTGSVPTDLYGSDWFYHRITPVGGELQYLKYWDGSYLSTYFVAYSPYTNGVDAPVFTPGATAGPTLKFQNEIKPSVDPVGPYLYASLEALNANHLSSVTTAGIKNYCVPLAFAHMSSQVKIALWENIEGYSVKMGSVKFSTASGITDYHGIVAIPADFDDSATPKYTRGDFVYSGKPEVVFTFTPTKTTTEQAASAAVSYYDVKNFGKNAKTFLEFASPDADTFIGTSHATRTFSPTVWNVVPNSGSSMTAATGVTYDLDKPNSGLQFIMTFTLVAEDTKEEIVVRDARAYVPATYTAWAPNTLYIYTFRITKTTSGTTTPDYPDPEPVDPSTALYPIIFNNVTVVDLTTDTTTDSEDFDVK